MARKRNANQEPPPVAPRAWVLPAPAAERDFGLDPLDGLSIAEARMIANQARLGDYAWLQRIFREIEKADPVLKVCVERRLGGASSYELGAKTKELDGKTQLEAEQSECIRTRVLCAENLRETVEHLALASFRGYSMVAPVFSGDGASVDEFDLLDTWNISRDGPRGAWLWNPGSKGGTEGLEQIPGREIVVVEDEAIDFPGMNIHIRRELSDRDWGRFVEGFGIPPCGIIMPQFASVEDERKFLAAAMAGRRGADYAMPYGTQVSWANEARGIEPFSAFCERQERLIVLMSTGGILTSLSDSTGIGQGASQSHEETWKQITARFRRIISEALHRQAAIPILRREFPGQPVVATLVYEDEPPQTAEQVFKDGAAAIAAGYRIAKEELERASGYKLEEINVDKRRFSEPENPEDAANRAQNSQDARNGAGKPRENARRVENGSTPAPEPKTPGEPVLRDLAEARKKDFAAVAGAIDKLLALDGDDFAEKAGALAKNLPSALGGMNAAAQVIERELAEAFAAGPERVENNNPNKTPDGKFASDGGDQTGGKTDTENPAVSDPDDYGPDGPPGNKESHAERDARKNANKAEGVKNMAEVEAGKDSKNFMKSPKGNNIAFYQGDSNSGYIHIRDKLDNNGQPAENHKIMLRDNNIPNTLSQGTYYETYGRTVAINGNKMVFFGNEGKNGKDYFIISAYEDKEMAASISKKNKRLENSEVGKP